MEGSIYTIGHSNHPSETFVRLLTQTEIEVLVDIRSNPGSQWASYANPCDLEQILRAVGIQYIYLGDMLGGQPDDPDCYNPQTGKADYKEMQKKEFFKRGINRLLEAMKTYHICVMCAEENPSSCHRNLLVSESLRREDVKILHIRGTGQIQTDEELWKENAGVGKNQLPLPM
ncbi:MAG TPA: DUF488 domain-containing protein [Dehalococcoidia bacterium]|nr:DUF488 domain-containing protein [Dehalococcoidia bacterium]